MKKLTIDFDGTLCTTAYPGIGRRRWIHKMVAWYVNKKHKQGWYIILNTLREHENNTLQIAIDACKDWGIHIDNVNDNYPPHCDLYGVNSRKIGSQCNIDDMNFGLFGWFLRRMDRA